MTAQETYEAMMEAYVRPRLRQLGFRGSRQNYSLPSASHFAMLGFQKSAFSTAERVRFTVNVLLVSQSEWAERRRHDPSFFPVRPTATTWHAVGNGGRIGYLTPEQEDTWWELGAGDDPEPVATEVLCRIEDHVLPLMRSHMGAND